MILYDLIKEENYYGNLKGNILCSDGTIASKDQLTSDKVPIGYALTDDTLVSLVPVGLYGYLLDESKSLIPGVRSLLEAYKKYKEKKYESLSSGEIRSEISEKLLNDEVATNSTEVCDIMIGDGYTVTKVLTELPIYEPFLFPAINKCRSIPTPRGFYSYLPSINEVRSLFKGLTSGSMRSNLGNELMDKFIDDFNMSDYITIMSSTVESIDESYGVDPLPHPGLVMSVRPLNYSIVHSSLYEYLTVIPFIKLEE